MRHLFIEQNSTQQQQENTDSLQVYIKHAPEQTIYWLINKP